MNLQDIYRKYQMTINLFKSLISQLKLWFPVAWQKRTEVKNGSACAPQGNED